MPTSPTSEELSSWIKSFQEIFLVFPGQVFKSQQPKMSEKKEFSPRNPPCSTCCPSAEGNTFISCKNSPLCCSREAKLFQDYCKIPNLACKEREHQVLFPRNRWTQGWCSQREGLEVPGVNSFLGVLKPPHLLWHPCLALQITFWTKNSVSHQNALKTWPTAQGLAQLQIRGSHKLIMVWKTFPNPRSGIRIGAAGS